MTQRDHVGGCARQAYINEGQTSTSVYMNGKKPCQKTNSAKGVNFPGK